MNPVAQNIESELDLSSLPDLADSLYSENSMANSKGEKFVAFFLNGELFAVSAKEVMEVGRPFPITPLPNSPHWLSGIAGLRGEIISVLNLPKILGKPEVRVLPKTKTVILKPEIFDSPVAFLVDKLSEIVNLKDEAVEPIENPSSPFLLGQVVYKSENIYLLDTEKLFTSLSVRS